MQLNTESFILAVCNGMSLALDKDEMKLLKDQLYINLHDVVLVKNNYDLVETGEDNDVAKTKYFTASKKISGKSDNTIKQYVRTAWKLRDFVGKNFADISAMDIRFYLAKGQQDSGWKTSTIENTMCYLSVFFGFLQKEGYIKENPVARIETVKEEYRLKEPFTASEMEKIRGYAINDVRQIALVEFLYATGVRVSELCSLKWKDIGVFDHKIKIVGKGRKERIVYFSEKAAYHLGRYADQRMRAEGRTMNELLERPLFAQLKKDGKTEDYEAISTDGVRYILNQISRGSGVKDIHPHRFRRTFATDALSKGMKLEELKEILGHADCETTLVYARVKERNVEHSYRTHCE